MAALYLGVFSIENSFAYSEMIRAHIETMSGISIASDQYFLTQNASAYVSLFISIRIPEGWESVWGYARASVHKDSELLVFNNWDISGYARGTSYSDSKSGPDSIDGGHTYMVRAYGNIEIPGNPPGTDRTVAEASSELVMTW